MFRIFVAASLMLLRMNHSFTVKNNGEHVILSVYISAVDRDNWEDDLLPRAIEPGYQHTFNLTEGCEQDVKIVFANGHYTIDNDVDTCENDLVTHY